MPKRLFALLLALVLIFSVLPLTAFARTAEGYYNGHYDNANLTTAFSNATTKMTYEGTEKIRAEGTIYYRNIVNDALTKPLYTTPQKSSVSKTETVLAGGTIRRVDQRYYIATTQVDTIEVSNSTIPS